MTISNLHVSVQLLWLPYF